MDWREQQALSNSRVYIVENIYDVNSILDDFIEAGVSEDDIEEIRVKPTRLSRKQSFLSRVPKWGPGAFNVLLKALKRTGYEHVSEKLVDELKFVKETYAAPCHRDTIPPWLSPQVGRKIVSERALHLIAQELPPTVYYILGSCLGLSSARLQQFAANNCNMSSMQLSTVLCDWRSAQSSQATIESLVMAMRKAKVDEDLYREILLDDAGVIRGQNLEQIRRMDSITSPVSKTEQWV